MKSLLSIAIVASCLSHTAARACTMPVPRTAEQAMREADVVVEGVGVFPKVAGEGTIRVLRTLKGRVSASLQITGREGWPLPSPLCAPIYSLKGSHRGIFYLVRLKSGRFDVFTFRERT